MDASVRALHTDHVHAAVARAVGVEPVELRSLGGFESFVYEAHLGGLPRIVKSTWSGRRSREEIGAELHFVRYLAERGAPVCGPVPLHDGALVATVPAAEGAFHVSAFEQAPGARLPPSEWRDVHIERWGRLVGCLHRWSASYKGPPPPLRRPTWEAEYAAIEALIAPEPEVHRRLEAVLDAIRALPRAAGSFGTMHTDLHAHNLHWHAGAPRAFDFDDMLDFWFVADLAIVLYYAMLQPPWQPDDRQADFERMRAALLRGYREEHELPKESLETMPLFLALREHTLRAVILRSVPERERRPTQATFLREATERILAGRPPLDLRM